MRLWECICGEREEVEAGDDLSRSCPDCGVRGHRRLVFDERPGPSPPVVKDGWTPTKWEAPPPGGFADA